MTIAEAVKTAGYATGHFGKWHVGGIPNADGGTGRGLPDSFCPKPRHPGNQGFDEWWSAGNWYDIGHESIYHNGEQVPPREGDTADVLMDVALEWIAKQAKNKKPFLALVWFPSPHGPHQATPAYAAPYETHGKAKANYYGELAAVDHAVGRLRKALREMKIADNTMLWFCSDNGGAFPLSTGGLPGGKKWLTEGGTRVPGTSLHAAETLRRIEFAFEPVAVDSAYQRRATWQETLRATIKELREDQPSLALGRCKLDDKWFRSGPHEWPAGKEPSDVDFGIPLTRVDLRAKKPDGTRVWDFKGPVKAGQPYDLKLPARASVFQCRQFSADFAGSMDMVLSSEIPLTFWHNGEKLYELGPGETDLWNPTRLTLNIRKGRNELIIRFDNAGRSGATRFYVRFNNLASTWHRTMEQLQERVARDFRSPRDTFEQGVDFDAKVWVVPLPPDDRVVFCSTAVRQGVPCLAGRGEIANLFLLSKDGQTVRQLCFDQDHNWNPTALNNGRILYSRWEYMDTPHYFPRLLFHMNPDGTGQMSYYGSNSYWPNAIFFARPIPGHPTKVVGIVSGHHGVARMGELVIFDPALGRQETDGVVQRIPGYGRKVEPVIADHLVNNSWPKFLHPYPVDEKSFLVAAQPTPGSTWGLYWVDVFDNMLLIKESDDHVFFEPLPFRSQTKPPVVADRVDLSRRDAVVYVQDVYTGPGLKGVPRGSITRMRLLEPHYNYSGARMGGYKNAALEGGWEPKRIIGTVPVEEDGSAVFRVPANTPLILQPVDRQGRAYQIMRSWMTAMPGESVSCIGCHENQDRTVQSHMPLASNRAPADIEPWYGLRRGFDFVREVQPVLRDVVGPPRTRVLRRAARETPGDAAALCLCDRRSRRTARGSDVSVEQGIPGAQESRADQATRAATCAVCRRCRRRAAAGTERRVAVRSNGFRRSGHG